MLTASVFDPVLLLVDHIKVKAGMDCINPTYTLIQFTEAGMRKFHSEHVSSMQRSLHGVGASQLP